MNSSQIFIAVVILSLAIIVSLLFIVKKTPQGKRLTPAASIAFACIVAGIIFSEHKLLGYSLIGVGVAMAVLDMFAKQKK